ncbi:MAG: hypothetical protein HFI29_01165 [Lachnospiraceae bacterium]|jgi:molybdopterin molybdotransferase|nr:hypothetical protein [Lachnospiraceae bacterium]
MKLLKVDALAALGKTEICVYRPWRVTIHSTGDELIEPSKTPKPGQIRDINTYGLCAQAKQEGMRVVACHIVPDVREALWERIREARESHTILAGLPGHPATAMLVFEQVLLWFFREKTGQREAIPVEARIETNVAGAPGKRTCQLVRLERSGAEEVRVIPIFGKSGMITTLTKADGYVLIEENQEGLKAGGRSHAPRHCGGRLR